MDVKLEYSYRALEATIAGLGPLPDELLKQRFSRSILVSGLDCHRKLSASVVVLVGIGAILTHVAEMLIRKGVGMLIVIDSDVISEHNLERVSIFDESALGLYKVDLVRNFAERVNHHVKVVSIIGKFQDIIQDTSIRNALRMVDLIVTGIDNGLGLYSVARFAYENNMPHIDGATYKFNAHAYIFPKPQSGPCYLCTMTKKDFQEISKIFSCTRNTPTAPIGPTIAESSRLAGDIVSTEAVKVLEGKIPDYHEIRCSTLNWHLEREPIAPNEAHQYDHVW
jgi:molybdopterin/thiamine biosynthesis adenylyltransferase